MNRMGDLPSGLSIFDLTGKTALVTGAGRGLGRSMAVALASAGADLVLAARTAADLDAVAAEVSAFGRATLCVPTDVTQPDQVDRLVAAAVDRFGAIDILVNNAGTNLRKPVLDISIEEWDQILNLNLRSYFHVSRAAGRHLVE
ncbi:MAG: SDR family NAD(P)-dependent oxidoreductase, partial [Dehalococcoidia bacterium]